jgi:hypothetical protein
MIKRTALFITLAAIVGTTVPQRSDANYDCMTGRITAATANTITVFDKESRTFTVDRHTRFTAWPTQGRWQMIARINQRQVFCDSRALDIGRLVAVHPRHDGSNTARWVQVAVNAPLSDAGYVTNACIY